MSNDHECRSPYCECPKDQCAQGRKDMRGAPIDLDRAVRDISAGIGLPPATDLLVPDPWWTLIAPDGRRFTGATPFQALKAEIDSRITPERQLENIRAAARDEHGAPFYGSIAQRAERGLGAGLRWPHDDMGTPTAPADDDTGDGVPFHLV